MTDSRNDYIESLRIKAEEALKNGFNENQDRSELANLLQEIRIYQTELEIQNDELRKTQKDLEISRDKYSFLFRNAPVGYVVLDKVGLIIDTNTRCIELFNKDIKQLRNHSFADLLEPESRLAFLERLKAIFKSPENKSIEVKIKSSDETKTFQLNFGRLAASELNDLLVTVTDITELRYAQDALAESEGRFKTIFETSPTGMAIVDTSNQKILMANHSFCNICGYGDKAIGMNVVDLTHPDDRLREADLIRKRLSGEIPVFEVEKRYLRPTGEVRHVKVSGAVFKAADDKTLGIANVLDITEEKELQAKEKDRLRIQSQLEKNEGMKRMAGAIAHHFNNNLAVVLGSLTFALDSVSPESTARTDIDNALDATRRSVEISKLLLTYLGVSHRESFARVLSSDLFSSIINLIEAIAPVGTVFKKCSERLEEIIKVKGAEITVLLSNIATNAWESMEEGGAVSFRCGISHPDEIIKSTHFPVDWSDSRRHVYLEISDEGSGIDPDVLPRIFDPFFTTKFIGRGMGLPVCLGIAITNSCVITVSSNPGSGTAFRLHIPVAGGNIDE